MSLGAQGNGLGADPAEGEPGGPGLGSPSSSGPFAGRTAWARNLASPVRDFLSAEIGGAVVLLCAVVAALVWANSLWSSSYESVWTTTLSVRLGGSGIAQDLRHWINEGLMTLFFLVVGLEAKRELDMGQLRERRRLTVPLVAALGGMAVPILIYLAFNSGGSGARGWGAAMSTDTAFALGLLALVAPGGTRLRVRLLTAAVFDDLVALGVIAVVYTNHLSLTPLVAALGLFGLLFAMRNLVDAWAGRTAAILGVALWVALYESGIDPVIAGLAIGLTTSAYNPMRTELEQATVLARSFREQPTPALARSAQRSVASAISPNERLQYRLHPWTSFVIVPLFALANAGIHLDGSLLRGAVSSPITLGIFFGYVVGKPLGIVGAAWIASRLWPDRIRLALSVPVIVGAGTVAGVGFTVSLLISSLAFHGRELEEAKLGVLAAGIVVSFAAWAVFGLIRRLPNSVRARQLRRTTDDIVDLSDDVDPSHDHIRGPDDALVTLLEYGDYECPYCGQAETVIRELLDAFGDDLRYVWRHLPLNDVHPQAQMAAEAAEAAAAQGAFWQMHDYLLAHQDGLAERDLERYADEIGLDADRFHYELGRREYAERVDDDVETADSSGVAGTPTFFINGQRHQGAYDIASLRNAVSGARRRAVLLRDAAVGSAR
jgi:Na+/H+ antiporter NhaA